MLKLVKDTAVVVPVVKDIGFSEHLTKAQSQHKDAELGPLMVDGCLGLPGSLCCSNLLLK